MGSSIVTTVVGPILCKSTGCQSNQKQNGKQVFHVEDFLADEDKKITLCSETSVFIAKFQTKKNF
ncbi:hypothetical protein X975_01479, partial [Stegodyphus mimosarum]